MGTIMILFYYYYLAAREEKAGVESQDHCVPGPSTAPASVVVVYMPSSVTDMAVLSISSAQPQPMGMYRSLPSLCSAPLSPAGSWLEQYGTKDCGWLLPVPCD